MVVGGGGGEVIKWGIKLMQLFYDYPVPSELTKRQLETIQDGKNEWWQLRAHLQEEMIFSSA